MKTTLALLIAGLIFLTTPLLASADGRHNDRERNHYKGWVKQDQHDQRSHNNRYENRRDHRYDQKRNHRVKNHLRRELRETRQELRQIKRQKKHNQRRPYYARPYRANPSVILGFPHVVFQFDW